MLSLLARPGDGGIRTRKVAILVADGVDTAMVGLVRTALLAAGAVPRLVGPHIGTIAGLGDAGLQADASLENEPGFLFDALVLPGGGTAVQALAADGRTGDFIQDAYRHGKSILVVGSSIELLGLFDIPGALPSGEPDPGLISVPEGTDPAGAIQHFIAAMGAHRHPSRDCDPPRV
jgi:catalase